MMRNLVATLASAFAGIYTLRSLFKITQTSPISLRRPLCPTQYRFFYRRGNFRKNHGKFREFSRNSQGISRKFLECSGKSREYSRGIRRNFCSKDGDIETEKVRYMDGDMWIYQRIGYATFTVFRTPKGGIKSSEGREKFLIFIGGLGDGLLATNYVPPLSTEVNKLGFTLLQPLLRSSYQGFGISSISKDTKDISNLVRHLRKDHPKALIVLMGHSTGCQDAVSYCKLCHTQKKPEERINGIILQAPVNDPEYFSLEGKKTEKYLKLAREMVSKRRGRELMPRECLFAPITADRYISLADRGGPDDLFSSTFEKWELESYASIDVPTLILPSGSDEAIPETVDKKAVLERLESEIKKRNNYVKSRIIPNADHACKSPEATAAVVKEVVGFLRTAYPTQ